MNQVEFKKVSSSTRELSRNRTERDAPLNGVLSDLGMQPKLAEVFWLNFLERSTGIAFDPLAPINRPREWAQKLLKKQALPAAKEVANLDVEQVFDMIAAAKAELEWDRANYLWHGLLARAFASEDVKLVYYTDEPETAVRWLYGQQPDYFGVVALEGAGRSAGIPLPLVEKRLLPALIVDKANIRDRAVYIGICSSEEEPFDW